MSLPSHCAFVTGKLTVKGCFVRPYLVSNQDQLNQVDAAPTGSGNYELNIEKIGTVNANDTFRINTVLKQAGGFNTSGVITGSFAILNKKNNRVNVFFSADGYAYDNTFTITGLSGVTVPPGGVPVNAAGAAVFSINNTKRYGRIEIDLNDNSCWRSDAPTQPEVATQMRRDKYLFVPTQDIILHKNSNFPINNNVGGTPQSNYDAWNATVKNTWQVIPFLTADDLLQAIQDLDCYDKLDLLEKDYGIKVDRVLYGLKSESAASTMAGQFVDPAKPQLGRIGDRIVSLANMVEL